MTSAPTEIDFMSLFEGGPILVDPHTPWVSNTSTYRLERDGYDVELQISPAFSNLKASLARDGHIVAEIEVTAFVGLEIETDASREVLIVRCGECSASAVFLQLKPRVSLTAVVSSDV